MDVLNDMFQFLILGHPMMLPYAGFIDLVSLFLVSFLGHRCSILRTEICSLASSPRPLMRCC
jgi:hypothetical protein